MTKAKTVYIGRSGPNRIVARVLGDPDNRDVLIRVAGPLAGTEVALSIDPVEALALADAIRRAALEVPA